MPLYLVLVKPLLCDLAFLLWEWLELPNLWLPRMFKEIMRGSDYEIASERRKEDRWETETDVCGEVSGKEGTILTRTIITMAPWRWQGSFTIFSPFFPVYHQLPTNVHDDESLSPATRLLAVAATTTAFVVPFVWSSSAAITTTSSTDLHMTVLTYKGKKKSFKAGSPLSRAVAGLGVPVKYSCKK